MKEITVQELKKLIDQHGKDLVLIDVREEDEWDIANIDGATLKPLSRLEIEYDNIPKDKPIYVHCKRGGRSAQAILFLQSKGYTDLTNVTGGIDAWADLIDTDMEKY